MGTDDERGWLTEDEAPTSDDRLPRFQQVGVTGGPDIQPVRPVGRRPAWLGPAAVGLAFVLVASLVGVWALATVLTAGADAARAAYAYIPARTATVIELRLDLPAGQREELGTLMSRFPGFGSASTVESLLVERLDELVRTSTEGRANYKDDVQSFFSGWVVAAMPPAEGAALDAADLAPLLILGVNDRAAAETAMLKLRPPTATWSVEEVDGVQVWSAALDQPAVDLGLDLGGHSYAVTDDALIYASSAEDVKLALATRAGTGTSLLDTPRFAEALRSVPTGRLGMAWTDIRASGAVTAIPGSASPIPACATLIAGTPTDAIAAAYLRDGRAVLEVTYSRPAGGSALPVRQSNLDTHVPADAFFYAEKKGAGESVTAALACLRSYPGAEAGLAELERSIGRLEDLVGWMGDAALALRYDGTKLTGGLLVTVNDELKSSEALGQLRAALTALGNEAGSVTVAEETYRDARLVTFDFSGEGLSSLPAVAPSTSLAYTLKGGLLVIGIDAGFARAVLDTEPSTSLAGKASYKRALEFSGASQNAGVVFLDIPTALSVIDAVSGAVPGAADGLRGIRQFLEPIDDLTMVTLDSDGATTLRITLNTRQLP